MQVIELYKVTSSREWRKVGKAAERICRETKSTVMKYRLLKIDDNDEVYKVIDIEEFCNNL